MQLTVKLLFLNENQAKINRKKVLKMVDNCVIKRLYS